MHRSQLILVSIDLSRLMTMLLFTMPRAVVLSFCMGIGGCLCPIYSKTIRSGIASRQLTKSAKSAASAAEDMTALIIFDMVMKAPLLGGFSDFSVKNNCPPALLQEPDPERYDALLCPAITLLLAR